MQKESLTPLLRHQLEIARNSSSGRSAHTVYGGHEHALRQTMIALRAGTNLDEHESPGEATVHVLHGRVTLVAGGDRWNGSPGDLLLVCSDGLWGQVHDSEILTAADGKSPEEACRDLIGLARERGGPDNITVQILRVN